MTFQTAHAFDVVCQLDRNDTLDEVPKNINKKLSLSYFLTNFTNKTLLVLSLAVP